jgi:hypothetical protein
VLWILNNGLIHTYIRFFVNTYIIHRVVSMYNVRPYTNRHVNAHKCLHCAGIEPATSSVVGVYPHHYATLAVKK